MGAAAETASSASSASMAPVFPLGAQFWAHVREPGRPARQVLGQVEGSERRASISERDQFPPAGLARPRPPSLAGGAAHKKLAGEERQRRWPAEGFGQRGVGAKKRERLGVALERNHRFGSGGGGDWGGPASRNGLLQGGGEVRRLFRIERRLQVGCDGGQSPGAQEVAGTREDAERGVDPSRRPEL